MGDVLANRSDTDEPKSIESKAMAMTFSKAPPDGKKRKNSRGEKNSFFRRTGKSSISAGDTSIRLPGFADLNTTDGSSAPFTKVLESKENPYASAKGNSSVQGSVVTIILSNPDGSEIPVQHTSKPITIRLSRPVDKRPKYQRTSSKERKCVINKVRREKSVVLLRSIVFVQVDLPEDNMTLSIHVVPHKTTEMFAVYVSYGINETMAEAPLESKFDFLFVVPNRTISFGDADLNVEDREEVQHTVFLSAERSFRQRNLHHRREIDQ